MQTFLGGLLNSLFRLGYFGPFFMGIMDSSFLFLPFGNDLLVVLLVARNHSGLPLYVISAVCGSTLGVFFLDLLARKLGEAGLQKMTGPRRFRFLKRKAEERAAVAILVGCLAPPPFPFTMAVAVTSALGYKRWKLLGTVAVGRAIRFSILGLLAVKYGDLVLRVANSAPFKWTMVVFIVICLVLSAVSVTKWVKGSRRGRVPVAQTAS